MKQLILLALAFSINAQASEYKLVYLDSKGQQVSPETALMNASKGEQVLKCQSVEAKVSKSGTSVSLRNVKKK